MKPQRLSLQGVAGLFAILAIAFVAFAPLVGAIDAAFEARAELRERQAAVDLLAARMDDERREMTIQAPDLYARSQSLPDATALNETLTLTCERVVHQLQTLSGDAGCSYSSTELGETLARQDATLTASGDVSALLKALDITDPDARITGLSVTHEPGQPAATMELRLHGLAEKAEASE